MKNFNSGKPFNGSSHVKNGKLRGATGTDDQLYLFCPKCPGSEIVRIIDYGVQPQKVGSEHNQDCKSEVAQGFTLALKIYCEKCDHQDFVTLSNLGWQQGCHAEMIKRQVA